MCKAGAVGVVRGFGRVRCDAYETARRQMICAIRGEDVCPHVDAWGFFVCRFPLYKALPQPSDQ